MEEGQQENAGPHVPWRLDRFGTSGTLRSLGTGSLRLVKTCDSRMITFIRNRAKIVTEMGEGGFLSMLPLRKLPFFVL